MPDQPGPYVEDPRNASLRISLDGEMVPRERALVSVFDAGFLLGDGVWEGIRICRGVPLFLDEHLDRLFEGAAALDLDVGLTREEFARRVHETIHENRLETGAHLRLMVTRGLKRVPYQDPALCEGRATVVIAPQYVNPSDRARREGLKLATVHVRRGAPDVQDPKINSHSKLNCVLACIQAKKVGADEALMLDPHGFVATCNSTHFFVVRRGEVWTSTGKYCLGGITRRHVLELGRANGIPCLEKDFSLTDVYGADEAFCTGTLAGLLPVREVDGRRPRAGVPGPVTTRLQALYAALVEERCARGG
ncbi:MAG: aminotransferase class IV [bacterium]